jgi:hypothetical protein
MEEIEMSTYWKTTTLDGESFVHLAGLNDTALCGFDLAGDTTIHKHEPKLLSGKRRVSCPQCAQMIALVQDHFDTWNAKRK